MKKIYLLFILLSPAFLNAQCWKDFSSGGDHSHSVAIDGSLWSWGINAFWQLGNDSTVNSSVPVQTGNDHDWNKVAAGIYHTLAIKDNGTAWAWGHNNYGQLGDGTFTNRSVPVQVGTDSDWAYLASSMVISLGIKTDGTLWVWGANPVFQPSVSGSEEYLTQPQQVGADADWVQASVGRGHVGAQNQWHLVHLGGK